MQAAVTIAFTYGWRRDEILTLQRHQLVLEAGTLRLDVGTTKNDDGREVDLTDELHAMLTAHVARVEALGRQLDPPRIIPHLFPHLRGAKTLRPGGRRRAPVLGEQVLRQPLPVLPRRDVRRRPTTTQSQA